MIELVKKCMKNTYSFAVISRTCNIITGLLYTILLSRYLGATLRGEYSVIQNYASIIAGVVGLGIYQAYPFLKRNAKTEEKRPLFNNISTNIVALYFVFLTASVMLAIFTPLGIRIKLTIVIIPLLYLYKQANYLVLIEYPRRCNWADMILGFSDILIVTLLILFTKADFFWCFIFLIVEKTVYAAVATGNLGIKWKENPPKITPDIRKYIQFGFVPMLTVLLMTLNYKVDIVMLSLFDNVSKAEIGVYSVGVLLAEKVWMLPDVLTNILQSKLAEGKNAAEVAKVSRISSCITILCLVMILIVGKPFIYFAYGNEYAGAYSITVIILLGVLGMVFYKVVYSYYVVCGRRKVNFILLLSSVTLNMVLNYLFIGKYGTKGAAIASLISFLLCGLMFLCDFIRYTKVSMRDMIILKREDIVFLLKFIKKRETKEKK